jgi:hypothetical protein
MGALRDVVCQDTGAGYPLGDGALQGLGKGYEKPVWGEFHTFVVMLKNLVTY